MEHITYRDQVIWGTSLGMAKEDEIERCYKYIKEYIETREDVYGHCEQSDSTKNFIDVRWLCGEAAHSSDLCNKQPSIKKENLILEIELMVSDEINVTGKTIVDVFKKRGYISIYNCDRVFFVK